MIGVSLIVTFLKFPSERLPVHQTLIVEECFLWLYLAREILFEILKWLSFPYHPILPLHRFFKMMLAKMKKRGILIFCFVVSDFRSDNELYFLRYIDIMQRAHSCYRTTYFVVIIKLYGVLLVTLYKTLELIGT